LAGIIYEVFAIISLFNFSCLFAINSLLAASLRRRK